MPPAPASKYSGRSVLITGIGGTVGHRLAARLCELGARVRGVDAAVMECGYRDLHRRLLEGRVEWIEGDLNDPAVSARAAAGMEIVFHLAGNGSHAAAQANPRMDLSRNLGATLALLEAIRLSGGTPRVVLGSTRQLYGRASRLPVTEDEPVKIVDVNAIHKHASEQMLWLYSRLYGLSGVALRLTNVMGPGMRVADSMQVFYGGWVRALLEGRGFEVWGGEQVRDLLHTEDATEAFVRAGVAEEAPGEVFNIGSGTGHTIRAVADALVAAAGTGGYTVRPIPQAQRAIDIGDYVADIAKAGRLLGWSPSKGLAETADETLSYYRAHLACYV